MSARPIVLASNSPRRRELIGLTGWRVSIQPASIDETPLPGESPAGYVYRLAEQKAQVVSRSAPPGALVIGADTTVADGEVILGKPQDEAEAVAMLRRLRGKEHFVYTAIVVVEPSTGTVRGETCATRVPMRAYTDEEIEAYVATGDPLDKAGAYAIQHRGFHPVEHLRGCYASVMGLPLCHLARVMRQFGLEPEGDLPARCQALLNYPCPVFEAIYRGEQIG